MSRSPSDATRFTATGPYIANKPTVHVHSPTGTVSSSSNPNANAASTPSSASSAPPTPGRRLNIGNAGAVAGETGQQKIKRLRDAATRARQGKETTFDRTVRIGRVWADRAHRFTALGLIGLTVVSGIVATAGITDMLMHNRRKRNEWLQEQEIKAARELVIAKRAEALGEASEDQRLLINRERAKFEAQEEKRNRPGVFKRTTTWLSGGLSQVEQKGGRLANATADQAEKTTAKVQQAAHSATEQAKKSFHDVKDSLGDAFRGNVGGAPSSVGSQLAGGPLDRQAQAAANAASSTTQGWYRWVTRT